MTAKEKAGQMFDWLHQISENLPTATKTGLTFSWRLLVTIFFVLSYFGWRHYSDNQDRNYAVLMEDHNTLQTIRTQQALELAYKQEDIEEHKKIFFRFDKDEARMDQEEEDIAELNGFTGLYKPHTRIR